MGVLAEACGQTLVWSAPKGPSGAEQSRAGAGTSRLSFPSTPLLVFPGRTEESGNQYHKWSAISYCGGDYAGAHLEYHNVEV